MRKYIRQYLLPSENLDGDKFLKGRPTFQLSNIVSSTFLQRMAFHSGAFAQEAINMVLSLTNREYRWHCRRDFCACLEVMNTDTYISVI